MLAKRHSSNFGIFFTPNTNLSESAQKSRLLHVLRACKGDTYFEGFLGPQFFVLFRGQKDGWRTAKQSKTTCWWQVFHTIGKKLKKNLRLQEYICFFDEENDTTKKSYYFCFETHCCSLAVRSNLKKSMATFFTRIWKQEKNYMKTKPEASLQSYQRY